MPHKDKEVRKAYQKDYHNAYREANKEEIAAKKKAYYQANKEKVAERHKAYREANKEKVAAKKKAWVEANKEEIAAKKKAWVEANKEKVAESRKAYEEANKEKRAEYYRTYKQANKEKVSAYGARRRALKRKQIPVHLRDCPKEKERLVQTYRLRNILSQATGVEHHVDHMWPLADGGPHWSGNLQVIPAEENLRKNASVCEDTKGIIIKSLYTFESERPI